MLELARDALSWILVFGGGVFVVIGAVGMLRMPDFFTRMHAASILDTFGASMILVGLMVQTDSFLVAVKLLFLLLFLLLTGPTATHALARAAVHAGLKPLLAGNSPEIDALAEAARAARPGDNEEAESSKP